MQVFCSIVGRILGDSWEAENFVAVFLLVLSRVADDALEFVDVFVHIFVEKRRVCKKEECSCVMCLQVFGKASSRIKGGRGREFVDVCVHISPRGAFGIRRFCSCVCAHLLRGAGVAEEFVDCFVHILSRGTEDAGDFC